jgi:hypothetical protein
VEKGYSHNSSHSDLIFVYIKEGGFVGMRQKIFYDSFTKELTFVDERSNTFRIKKLTGDKEKDIRNEAEDDKIFDTDQNYPPRPGSADFISFGLFIIINNKSHSVKWTEASQNVPNGLSKFASVIENMTSTP